MTVRVQREVFDIGRLIDRLQANDPPSRAGQIC
jgi:hypothetical protein